MNTLNKEVSIKGNPFKQVSAFHILKSKQSVQDERAGRKKGKSSTKVMQGLQSKEEEEAYFMMSESLSDGEAEGKIRYSFLEKPKGSEQESKQYSSYEQDESNFGKGRVKKVKEDSNNALGRSATIASP